MPLDYERLALILTAIAVALQVTAKLDQDEAISKTWAMFLEFRGIVELHDLGEAGAVRSGGLPDDVV